MNKHSADQIIKAYDDAFQKMSGGSTFQQGMKQLYKLAKRDLQRWKQARTKQGLVALLLKDPEPSEQTLAAILAMTKLLPYLMRQELKKIEQNLPANPGGRPSVITPQAGREICAEIGALLGQGVELPIALNRVAERHRKPNSKKSPLHTIKRVWYERNNPKSRFYLDSPIEKNVPHKEALILTET